MSLINNPFSISDPDARKNEYLALLKKVLGDKRVIYTGGQSAILICSEVTATSHGLFADVLLYGRKYSNVKKTYKKKPPVLTERPRRAGGNLVISGGRGRGNTTAGRITTTIPTTNLFIPVRNWRSEDEIRAAYEARVHETIAENIENPALTNMMASMIRDEWDRVIERFNNPPTPEPVPAINDNPTEEAAEKATEEKPSKPEKLYEIVPRYKFSIAAYLNPERVSQDCTDEYIPIFYTAKIKSATESVRLFRFKKYKESLVGKTLKINQVSRNFECSKDGVKRDCIIVEDKDGRKTKFLLSDVELKPLNIKGFSEKKIRNVYVGSTVKCFNNKSNRLISTSETYKVLEEAGESRVKIQNSKGKKFRINKKYLKLSQEDAGKNKEVHEVQATSAESTPFTWVTQGTTITATFQVGR